MAFTEMYFFGHPKTQIRDCFSPLISDNSYTNAAVSIDVELSGTPLTNSKITAKLLDNGSVIATKELTSPVIGKNTIAFPVNSPKKWSAEIPNLYDLVLSLEDNTEKY